MKTAEEFLKALYRTSSGQRRIELIIERDEEMRREGMTLAAGLIQRRADNYDAEHGFTDPETGTTEYPKRGDEYMAELSEIKETIERARDNRVAQGERVG